ncbi:MAG TPA: hypothetical protein VIL74_02480 [Pyrinomonadaceae bacterium]|jgi:hypothetical protein
MLIIRENSRLPPGRTLDFSLRPAARRWRASFKGRATLQKINPATGLVVGSWGNYTFTVDARDGDLLSPRQTDGYAVTILDGSGAIWRRVGTNLSLIPVGGGNVHVKGR